MKHLKTIFACLLMAVLSIGQVWGADVTGTINFGSASGSTAVNSTSVTGDDSQGNEWTVTTTFGGQTSFTQNASYSQIGASSKPASSITFTTTLASSQTIKAFSAKFGGFSGTAGTVTLKVGDTEVGTGSLNATTDVTVNATNTTTAGTVLTVTVTGISKGVKAYYISYTYAGSSSTPSVSADPDEIENVVAEGVTNQTIDLTYENITDYETQATVHPNADGTGTLSPAWLTASVTDADDYATVTYSVATNEGAARTAYIKVYTTDGDKAAETIIPVSQVKYSAPTGTFEPFSENIEEGDYLIVADGAGMNTTVSGNRLQYTALTLTGENYVNPDESVIWHIAESATAGYWTIYSGAESKYAAATGSNNQAQMLASGTDDKSLWTITHSGAAYTIQNKSNSRYLKKNGTYGFACYGDGTVSLYKLSNGKEAAGLAFDAADAQKLVKVGGSLEAPTLTNPNSLTVSYASGNTDVVEVDASGAITAIKAAGVAVITASTVGDATHNPGSASYTIFVAEQAGTESDPLSEANAKTLIDNGCTLTVHVNGLVLSQDDGNYTVTLTNGFKFYKAKDLGNVAFTSAYLGVGDEVTAVGQLTKYNTTYELAEGCYLTFYEAATTPLTPIANDEATAYTVEQALIYAAAPTTYDLSDIVYVRGKVAIASTALFSNKYLTYSISDDGTTTNVLKVYNGLGIGGADFTSKDDILVGEVVVVKGNLTQYNTELELAANNELVSKKPVATIAIENMELEYEEVATISATITPAAAASTVVYNIKAGSDDVITLAGDEITAKSVTGTATIVATIASTDDYEGVTKEFTVSVSEGDTRKKATLTSFAIGGVFDVTDMIYAAYQGDAANPVYISGTGDEMRLYKPGTGKTTGGYIVINAVKGCTIDEVIVYNGSAKATTIGCSTTSTLATSGEAYAKSASVSFKNLDATVVYIDNIGSDRMDIKKIEVFYTGDAAAVDHYELGGTYQTEFEIDDEFNHDGLVVYMAYDAGGTEKLEITPACTFSEPDMSVAGTPTVNITFAGGVVKTYDITVAASTLLDPELSYDPTSVTLTQGDALSAPTLNNPHTLDLTFNSNKTSVATVDEFGVIALAGGTGTATITASFAGDATYQAGNATFTITVNEPEEDLTGTWEFATSVAAGDRIIIASIADAGAVTTMGAQNGNNRSGVASTVAGTELTPAAGTKSVTLVDAGEGKFALQLNNGSYLYASSNSGNQLKETAAYADNENAKWTISISEGVATITAQGTNSHNLMRFNPNSGSPLFNCYTSSSTTGTLVTIYKKDTPEPPTPTADYTRDVTVGNYGTICLPNGGTISGAKLYDLEYYDGASTLYLLEVNGNAMVAGRPYIFLPSVATIEVFYTDDANEPAGSFNGLVGSYTEEHITPDGSNYILLNNQYYRVVTDARVGAYRAYIHMEDVPNAPAPQQGAPRRRVAMAVNGTQTATGIEDLNASEKPMKMMINGQIFILRGEKMYDTTGRLVK